MSKLKQTGLMVLTCGLAAVVGVGVGVGAGVGVGCGKRPGVGVTDRETDAGGGDPEAGVGDPDAGGPDGAVASCPVPVVFCNEIPPSCPPGSYPEADPCPHGWCANRCWTGSCATCGTECAGDADCALVGRHGCCGMAGDCFDGCFWAMPVSVLAEDSCYFEADCPVPTSPPSCPADCVDDPRCLACPHCGPSLARCEGGACVSAWPSCEPTCMCD
jgi:hypothetical protein